MRFVSMMRAIPIGKVPGGVGAVSYTHLSNLRYNNSVITREINQMLRNIEEEEMEASLERVYKKQVLLRLQSVQRLWPNPVLPKKKWIVYSKPPPS